MRSQARSSLRALVEALPDLSHVHCYDLHSEAGKRYIDEMNRLFPSLKMKNLLKGNRDDRRSGRGGNGNSHGYQTKPIP